MMMPANYSVIAENEMTYVNGGASFIDAIGAVTAPIWNLDNVKAFSTNIVTLIGDSFGKVVGADKFKAGQIGDGIAAILGSAAAIYNLGRTEVKNTAGDVKLFNGSSAKYTFKKDADGNWAIF